MGGYQKEIIIVHTSKRKNKDTIIEHMLNGILYWFHNNNLLDIILFQLISG